MDPVFFIKSTKIGVFYQYGYIDITKNRDPCTKSLKAMAMDMAVLRIPLWYIPSEKELKIFDI